MPKFSVKKPFTVLVAVILVVVLGFVSLAGMQTDLLPNMNLPYLLVVTTYPGASPEQVESDVTQPLENSLSTLNGVKNVTSQLREYIDKYSAASGEKFTVTEFSDGDEIAFGYKAVYDIILMDIEMKFMDGMMAAEEIRRWVNTRSCCSSR